MYTTCTANKNTKKNIKNPIKHIPGIIICHLNINRMYKKTPDLNLLLDTYNIDILCLTETWLSSHISNAELFINPSFDIHRLDRPSNGGGILLLSRRKYACEVENTLILPHLELMHISLSLPHTKNINIIVLYRPPSSSIPDFFETLSLFLNGINYLHHYLLLLGDLNIDAISHTDSKTKQLNKMLNSYHLHSMNKNLPTRITCSTSTLIDPTICNTLTKDYVNSLSVIHTGMSDHSATIFSFKKVKKITDGPQGNTFIQHVFNEKNKKNFINSIPFNYETDNSVDDMLKVVLTTTLNAIQQFPTRHVKHKIKSYNWIDKTYTTMAKHRDNLYVLAKQTRLNSDLIIAKAYRNKCNIYLKKTKKQYFNTLFNNVTSPREGWKLINNFMPNSSGIKQIEKITFNSVVLTDTISIANAFNSYYVNTVTSLLLSHFTTTIYTILPAQYFPFQAFSFQPITVNEILKEIPKLEKKGTGLLSIPYKFIAIDATYFSSAICKIVNKSFNENCFPSYWKHSVVNPKHKKGSHLDIGNYRPISILPNLSKIIERISTNQIRNYLNSHNLLYSKQSGFRKHHSTLTCTIDLLNTLYLAYDNHMSSIIIFLDFSKAFDSINHKILLYKLKNMYNFSDSSTAWISSYLTGRTQQVKINKTLSDSLNTTIGVPQGSILGPLLFLLFINDLYKCITHSQTIMYADDTTLVLSGHNLPELTSKMNHDLQKLSIYCKENNLLLNTQKTQGMFISSTGKQEPLTILLNNDNILFVDNFKFLGYHISNTLSLHHHITHILTKLSTCIKILLKCQSFLDISQLQLIYNSIGLSYIMYAAPLLATCTKNLKKQLNTKHVECGKAIIGIKRSAYIRSKTVLSNLNWPTIDELLLMRQLSIIKSCLSNTAPDYLTKHFSTPNHRTLNVHISQINKSKTKHAFFSWGPSLWNSQDHTTKTLILNKCNVQI